jgi:flavodoxin
MKNVIVHYSFTKNNGKLADYLQKKLNCDSVKIETVRKRTGFSILLDLVFKRNPEIKHVPYYLRDYDHVIFIAPIWAGKIAMPMKSYMINEKRNVTSYSFITLCGGRAGQKEKIQKELSSILSIPPADVVELWINNLLPADKKDTVKHTSGYRIESTDFSAFDREIDDFLKRTELTSIRQSKRTQALDKALLQQRTSRTD